MDRGIRTARQSLRGPRADDPQAGDRFGDTSSSRVAGDAQALLRDSIGIGSGPLRPGIFCAPVTTAESQFS